MLDPKGGPRPGRLRPVRSQSRQWCRRTWVQWPLQTWGCGVKVRNVRVRTPDRLDVPAISWGVSRLLSLEEKARLLETPLLEIVAEGRIGLRGQLAHQIVEAGTKRHGAGCCTFS